MTTEFDLNKVPLKGTNLIEAAAGTGKTYNIAGLFVRLILEKQLTVNEILVVTFTKAATEELKGRIRAKIQATIEAFETGRSDDTMLEALTKNYDNRPEGVRRLKAALREFDEAAIYTIHSFCQKMLHDNAFESGSLFDTELLTDQSRLIMQVVDDFWGEYFENASPLFVDYITNSESEKIDRPEKLAGLLNTAIRRLSLKVIPQTEKPSTAESEKAYTETLQQVKSSWSKARKDVSSLLLTYDGLNRSRYKENIVNKMITSMDALAANESISASLFEYFDKFASSVLKASTKKNHEPPYHVFFETCEALLTKYQELVQTYNKYIIFLKTELLNFAKRRLQQLKRDENIFSYDDLLTRMHAALMGPSGKYLAESIRRRFKAALIDEFQDTDPVQYDIFATIFDFPESILFLIGDPKQAIYSFRGADIFAYMKAIRQVDNRYTLSKNWRSEDGLVKAVNEIFSGADRPFIFEEIPFIEASAAITDKSKYLHVDNKLQPSCHLWFYGRSSFNDAELYRGYIKKLPADLAISRSVAGEISNLLSLSNRNRLLAGDRKIQVGNIAVLVRKNKEARIIQEALFDRNIPSVLYSTENVFDSPEALDMERLLAAMFDPNDDNLIRSALTTNLFGISGNELYDIISNTKTWENWLVKFNDYHDRWNGRGFIPMFRTFLIDEKIKPLLLAYPDGERRLTNILHLAELLHQAETSSKLGLAGLVKWLANQRSQQGERLEENQLRLESDENAVKIVTIHKSKGLQYDIVFCPFTWGGSRFNNKQLNIFHDRSSGDELTLDLGSEDFDTNKGRTEIENLAENLRLLYVALTRARHRVYMAWGLFNGADTSAPAYLLHQRSEKGTESILDNVSAAFGSLNDSDVQARLQAFQKQALNSFEVTTKPSEASEPYEPFAADEIVLESREFSGLIDTTWRISSFSNLTSGKYVAAELPDYDSAEFSQETAGILADSGKSIFTFPKGARAGTFFHDIFEHLDFASKESSVLEELVARTLKAYGYEDDWLEIIIKAVRNVLDARLPVEGKDFNLSGITLEKRLSELEFYFPLRETTPDSLAKIFSKYGSQAGNDNFASKIAKLRFSTIKGFLKGYIDLVFEYESRYFIIDWKSNFLGNRIEDYSEENLNRNMNDNYYTLQYSIYCAALHKYLISRLPGYDYDKHFGGVYYIYLRGVAPQTDKRGGIFYNKPSRRFIEELTKVLIG